MLNLFRGKEKKPGAVKVANLDALLARDQLVTLHGRNHRIKVPQLQTWIEIVSAQNELMALREKVSLSSDELIEAYFKFISKMCDSISKDDLRKCSQMQVSSLWQICLDMMAGYTQKKTQTSLMLITLTPEEINRMILILNRLNSMSDPLLRNSSQQPDGVLTTS